MKAQHWICKCGHEFYWILDKPRNRLCPNCPNCHSFKRMESQGMVNLTATPVTFDLDLKNKRIW